MMYDLSLKKINLNKDSLNSLNFHNLQIDIANLK